jgi:uncharacterized membrane protein
MTKLMAAYGAGLVILGVLDGLWLGLIAKDFYRAQIGHLMAGEVNIGAAAAFYLLYPAGVVLFAVLPALEAGSLARAVALGAALGFLVYMTYDLSNLATLRGWPWQAAAVDIAWGTFLTAAMAVGGFFIARRFL